MSTGAVDTAAAAACRAATGRGEAAAEARADAAGVASASAGAAVTRAAATAGTLAAGGIRPKVNAEMAFCTAASTDCRSLVITVDTAESRTPGNAVVTLLICAVTKDWKDPVASRTACWIEVIGATRPVLRVCTAVGRSPVAKAWTAVTRTTGMAPRASPNLAGMDVGPINRPATVELKYAKTSVAAAVTNGVAWVRNSVAMALAKSAGTRLVISGIAPPIPRDCSSETMSVKGRVNAASVTSATAGVGTVSGLRAPDSTGASAIAPTPTTATIPAVRDERTEICMAQLPSI